MDIEKTKTGTTTLGVVCKDGVVVAADQQATMGYLVASDTTQKVFKIADNMVMTIAGTAGDGQALARILKAELKIYEFKEGKLSVDAVATLLSNILRSSLKSYRPEMVQLIVGGFDESGPALYTLDVAGAMDRTNKFAFTGSGSVIALGLLEAQFKKDMSLDEGTNLILKAIKSAKARDVYTGGPSMTLAKITDKGVEMIMPDDVLKILEKID